MWGKTNILSNFQERVQLVLYSINAKVVPLALRSLSPPGSAAFSCIKLHQCSFCLWWHQYLIVYLISSQEETADYIYSLFSTLQAIPKLPSHKVNMVALWGDYLKFATLRSNEVEKLMEMKGGEIWIGNIWERTAMNEFQYSASMCSSTMRWAIWNVVWAEQGQGKEEDDKASDTFPFHRQQGREKKIQQGIVWSKWGENGNTWKGRRQYWVNAYSWDWNRLLSVISCK